MRAMQRLLIIGCGDVVRRALPWLTRRYRVYATVRHAEDGPALRALGVTPLLADLDRPKSLFRLAGLCDLLLHSAPPPDRGEEDARTRRLLAALATRGSLPRRGVYISTTGIYGDCAGAEVDETRPPAPKSARGRRRLDAERRLRAWGARCGVGVTLLRAPGIYAADRLPIQRVQRGDPVLQPAQDVHTNHIHAEDLARIVALALTRGRPNRAINAVDDTRLTMGAWFDKVADTFGLPRPPRVSREEAVRKLSPMTISFMGESRILANRRLKQELRYRFLYPDVAAGLAAAIHQYAKT